ncbi:SMP-30/gluconolactonase/LRE family protein [Burkholderiaceae bacterium FT117]|uniref:SMP-30/gluconolactonase/LRE family protein n=1 Tax=Zeimonas sediminis TaxID=2944268 RepID=UPI0023432096|nr:SMP-30/gluconolactonase/LRE family protein [Zeimonas sediminis]MCM5569704.1 SMP-30/gluconolactonase/LRE family protein [Zeimonas sediminis]
MRIREIASGLQFPEGPVAMDDGSVLLVEIARGTLTRVAADGKVSVVADLGGGPNGAAIGPDGAVYVCNNGGFRFHTGPDGYLRPVAQAEDYSGGRIERVSLSTGRGERVLDTVDGAPLRGPNDLVFDAQGGLWFTDLGKVREREMDRGGVYYTKADGSGAVAVARPAMTPNGIALSPDGRTLYYAETEGARLWAFDVTGPGQVRRDPWPSPHGGRQVAAAPGGHYQRFDSMAVDAFGNVCVATLLHGGITVISPDGSLATHVPMPDRYTTNLCFGGKDMRTVYVTLSGVGKLVAIDDWPVPGLRLNFNA